MIPASFPTTNTQNYHALFADKSSVNEKSNKLTYFLGDTTGTPIPYTKHSIDNALLLIEKRIAETRENASFVSTRQTKNGTAENLFMPQSMLHSSHIPVIDKLDLLISYLNSLYSLVRFLFFKNIQVSLENMGFSKCAERIDYLRSDDAAEDDEPLSPESAQGFVKLMRDFPDLGEPLLGLFPQGTLGVEWRIANDKHLLVEPFDSESACFALIGPSTEQGKRLRLNGRGSISAVIRTLRNEDVDQWQSV